MDRLLELVPAPHTRLPITLQSIAQLFLPPFLFYYVTAVLVLIPGTLYARLALLPLTLWSAFRASTKLDFAKQFEDERFIYLNHGLLLMMTTLALRAVVWSFEFKPYYRLTKSGKPKKQPLPFPEILSDAFDLMFNLRGLRWNWSEGLFIPKETRPTHSRLQFCWATFKSMVTTMVVFDAMHYAVQQLGPDTFATAEGGSIYDPSLPLVHRYLLSTLVTFLAGFAVVAGIQYGYLAITLVGVGILQNDPESWPPAFDKPWVATSLNEFWAKRWHQSFRDIFVGVGSKPLHYFLGKPGIVLGAFLVSGVLHVFGLWGMGRGTEFWTVAGYFLLMGLGIVLEHIYKNITGKRVQGLVGWIWTLAWVVGWGNLLVDAWFRKGLGGSAFFGAEEFRPVTIMRKVVGLGLHAIQGSA
ncbi:hypothetical protein CC1G_06275 [Coprinopsis cinerea okayama7|uniref:Wax synthase domain-containing protein n=1 Tax=Coprinopsis cinerea (strain Okayama-7 / 130 / ATCC MYA-4618 / FGSC 9003) TaxID=240176 RepID=A8NTB7_COPC7|nr:hypothetical protein CC1G_06275 [Coprinopsis cinerea okayama7\|eukprot:XP_001836190.1 hypothetical protein CC1G_06275 [Coprinopsis cinerea okayama7\